MSFATVPCRRARSALVSVPYATSRVSSLRNRNSSSSTSSRSFCSSWASDWVGIRVAARGQCEHELHGAGVPDHRSVLQRHAVEGVEAVEARREQSVQGRRQLARALGRRGLAQHRDELLDEERVATAAVPEDRDQLVVRGGEQRAQQDIGVIAREGIEVDVHRVVTTGRWHPAIGQLGPGGSDDHHRSAREVREEAREEVEHGVVPPVQVGEHEHEWLRRRERGEEREHGPERFFPGARGVDAFTRTAFAHEVQETLGDATDLRVVVEPEHAANGGACARRHLGLGIGEVDLASLRDHRRNRPPHVRLTVRDALTVQEQRALLTLRDRVRARSPAASCRRLPPR